MTGKFLIQYSFDAMVDDEQYQARTWLQSNTVPNGVTVDAWANSYGQARADLIKIIESIPNDEEIDICGI